MSQLPDSPTLDGAAHARPTGAHEWVAAALSLRQN